MKTICIIIPYFGREPDYFRLWELSAGYNRTIDFYLITDLPIQSHYPNIHILHKTFAEVQNRAKTAIRQDVVLEEPYKLCDYKPVYAVLFPEIVSGYDFWGYCDVDLIFGDIRSFVTEELLEQYDKLYVQGHFTLYRNSERLNRLFLENCPKACDWETAFYTGYPCHFDESGTVAHSEYFGISTYRNFSDFADVHPRYYGFLWGGGQCAFQWKNGVLERLFPQTSSSKNIESFTRQPVMYAHLQKRKMTDQTNTPEDGFMFIPNQFFDSDEIYLRNLLFAFLSQSEKQYLRQWKVRSIKGKLHRIRQGAILFHIKMRKWKK